MVTRQISDLSPNPRNARTHSRRQIEQLAAVIKKVGFIVPVIVDEDGTILAGHGRVQSALLLGLTAVPTIQVKHLTAAMKRAFMLADNRIAELAGWNEEILATELLDLSLEVDFDFEITGFDSSDLDRLSAPKVATPAIEEAVLDLDRKLLAVAAPGDLWKLGDHLIYCGSALDETSYQTLMGQAKAQLVCADPPYNVSIGGHVCGLGSVKHREFQMASGEMTAEEFTRFLAASMGLCATHSMDGAIAYFFMDWRHMREMLAAAEGIYHMKNLCIWNKTNAGMSTFYRSQHELVFVYKKGEAAHVNNFGLGNKGRYRTNVWTYAGVNTFKRGRMDELRAHPTVKPLAMIVDAIKDCSNRRGIVLDPFLGSGTTILAAEKTGRVGRGIELDPHYVDAAIERWHLLTGKTAVHAGSGQTFEERAAQPPSAANEA